jgi:hypothetical protein
MRTLCFVRSIRFVLGDYFFEPSYDCANFLSGVNAMSSCLFSLRLRVDYAGPMNKKDQVATAHLAPLVKNF